jgi:hypothetical protein
MRTSGLLLFALAVAASCGDPLGLPPAVIPNRVDTLSLYALSGTPVSSPSAYAMEFRQAVRTDQNAAFDFVFEIDTAGRALLLSTGAMRLGRQSGIRISAAQFDSIRIAPNSGYQLDSAIEIHENTVVLLHSHPVTCSFGLAALFYAKLHVLAVDTTSGPNGRRMDFEVLTNINCGYRGLEVGLPRR